MKQQARVRHPSRPTPAELEILQVLWQLGPATVRQIHETMPAGNDWGYTTVLKLLQLMHQKGLVIRDDSERAHVYAPATSKEKTQQTLLKDFVSRVFEGSSSQLVMQILGSGNNTNLEERQRIRDLLEKLEGGE